MRTSSGTPARTSRDFDTREIIKLALTGTREEDLPAIEGSAVHHGNGLPVMKLAIVDPFWSPVGSEAASPSPSPRNNSRLRLFRPCLRTTSHSQVHNPSFEASVFTAFGIIDASYATNEEDGLDTESSDSWSGDADFYGCHVQSPKSTSRHVTKVVRQIRTESITPLGWPSKSRAPRHQTSAQSDNTRTNIDEWLGATRSSGRHKACSGQVFPGRQSHLHGHGVARHGLPLKPITQAEEHASGPTFPTHPALRCAEYQSGHKPLQKSPRSGWRQQAAAALMSQQTGEDTVDQQGRCKSGGTISDHPSSDKAANLSTALKRDQDPTALVTHQKFLGTSPTQETTQEDFDMMVYSPILKTPTIVTKDFHADLYSSGVPSETTTTSQCSALSGSPAVPWSPMSPHLQSNSSTHRALRILSEHSRPVAAASFAEDADVPLLENHGFLLMDTNTRYF